MEGEGNVVVDRLLARNSAMPDAETNETGRMGFSGGRSWPSLLIKQSPLRSSFAIIQRALPYERDRRSD